MAVPMVLPAAIRCVSLGTTWCGVDIRNGMQRCNVATRVGERVYTHLALRLLLGDVEHMALVHITVVAVNVQFCRFT